MNKRFLLLIVLIIPVLMISAANIKPFSKHLSAYNTSDAKDRNWHILDRVEQDWTGSQWENSEKYVYFYNSVFTARTDSVVVYNYEEDAMMWVRTGVINLTYLPGTMYCTSTEMIYSFGPVNFPFVRTYSTFDSQNRLTTWRISMYDMSQNLWQDMTRMTIVYGANNTFMVYQWETGDDENPPEYGKSTFDFDGMGRVVLETWQTSPDSTDWVNEYQTTRSYHPHDNTTGASFIQSIALNLPLSMIMDDGGPSFGMVAQELEKDWENNAWVDDYKAIYTYNAQDKLTQELEQYWNGSAWIDEGRELYTYDTNNNVTEYLYQYYNGANWNDSERYLFSWTQFTTVDDNIVPKPKALSISAYPNPFTASIELFAGSKSNQSVKLEMYNLKGQLVYNTIVEPNQKFVWNGRNNQNHEITPGMYFIKAIQGKATSTHKVLRLN